VRNLQPPHNADAEMAVLASIMRWGSQCLADVRAIMGDDALFCPPSRAIFEAMRSLDEQGRPLDKISIEAELRTRKTFEIVGGPAMMERVRESAPDRSRETLAHATLVAELAQSRAAITVAQELAATLIATPLTGDALAAELAGAAERITDIARNGAGGKMPWTAKEVGDESERERQQEIDGVSSAISTGFPRLDNMCKRRGPRPGWVIVLSGRPKMGKTSAALQMAIEALFDRSTSYPVKWRRKANPTPVIIGCDEMRSVELYDRLVANLAGLDAAALASPTQSWLEKNAERIKQAREMLDSSPLTFVPDEHSNDLTKSMAYVRRWRRTHKIVGRDKHGNPIRKTALAIFDFLQSFGDMPGTEKKGLNEREGAKVKFIKDESKRLHIVSLVLSQLNRDLEKRDRDQRRPLASDNEGSGKIEQYADVLLGCYRDAVYDEKEGEYKDQVTNLRGRAAVEAKKAGVDIGKVLAELDEMIAIRNDRQQQTRYDSLMDHCMLGVTEFDELYKATTTLSAAEIIVQANRHGPTGTVYVDFFGHHYRFLPRKHGHERQDQASH
jgi:replicative DNA helicase